MGLAINIGMLADLLENDVEGAEWLHETFSRVNEVLRENELPSHQEPEQLPPMQSRANVSSYPYSYLHYLRRFYAYVVNDPDWIAVPISNDKSPTDDPVLDEEMYMMSSHLLCHSDAEGFYLPIEFDAIIIDAQDQGRIPGGILGSTYCLMNELIQVAPKLDIRLSHGCLSDDEANKLSKILELDNDDFWIEKTVWFSLFEAARLSIEYKTAICFS